jgi:hypothetical protein
MRFRGGCSGVRWFVCVGFERSNEWGKREEIERVREGVRERKTRFLSYHVLPLINAYANVV